MNNEKANLIATLAHAANNLRNVTSADRATNAILERIVELAKPAEQANITGEVEARTEGDAGVAEAIENTRSMTKLELITAALREKYPACQCGECPPIHVLVQLEGPVPGTAALDETLATRLAQIVTKPGADHVFVARAKEVLAAAGYAIVTL